MQPTSQPNTFFLQKNQNNTSVSKHLIFILYLISNMEILCIKIFTNSELNKCFSRKISIFYSIKNKKKQIDIWFTLFANIFISLMYWILNNTVWLVYIFGYGVLNLLGKSICFSRNEQKSCIIYSSTNSRDSSWEKTIK